MLSRRLALVTTATALAAVLTACSSSGGGSSASSAAGGSSASAPASSSAPAATASATSSAASSSSAAAPTTVFGAGCAKLGLTPAALAPAAGAPVGIVAAQVPFLSSVVAATKAAGLTAILNAAPAITVFAPIDSAFKKEPKAQLHALLTNPKLKPQLVKTLQYHVVAGKLSTAQLPGKHATLTAGASLTITGRAGKYTINGKAHILCGGIQTKNAVVELIDTVLHPGA